VRLVASSRACHRRQVVAVIIAAAAAAAAAAAQAASSRRGADVRLRSGTTAITALLPPLDVKPKMIVLSLTAISELLTCCGLGAVD
jgi:hypothetical protein